MKHEGFTPGPWTLSRYSILSDHKLIAEVYGPSGEQRDANATLLLAAPWKLAGD